MIKHQSEPHGRTPVTDPGIRRAPADLDAPRSPSGCHPRIGDADTAARYRTRRLALRIAVRVTPPAYQTARTSSGPVATPHGCPKVNRSIDIR